MIAPDVHGWLAFPEVTYSSLPMVDVVDALTMRCTSTREADEAWFQVGNHFGKVFTKSVGMSLEGLLWEERNEVEVDIAGFNRLYHQFCFVC